MPTLRWLVVLAGLETATLAVLVLNRVTVHNDAVTSLMGPIHGTCYLAVIAVGFLVGLPGRAKWLCVVPVIGGLLAVRAARRAESVR